MANKKVTKSSKKKAKAGEVWEITVFLLRPKISFKDALHKNAQAKSVKLHDMPKIGAVALKESAPAQPKWASRLATLVPDAAKLQQQSPGAVLFLKASGHHFAITFGYGRSLLAPESIVHDFGIRAVLNAVDPSLIRSLDSRTLEVSPQLSRKQFVEERPLAAFAIDKIHDLLKGVTGRVNRPVSKLESELITGTDSLHCRVRVRVGVDALDDLVNCCSDFVKIYAKTDYKKNFEFIDHVRFVRDPLLLKTLDGELVAKAKAAGLKDFAFAPPRVLSGDELDCLQCSWRKKDGPGEIKKKLIWDRLSEQSKNASTPEDFVERLKRDRIDLFNATGDIVEGWSLYRCLLLEVPGKKVHILTAGDWYEISKDFVTEISTRFDSLVKDSISRCPILLPSQQIGRMREDEYNADAAAALGIELFDKKSLTTGTGASAVEPCDLLDTKRGIFVHVKIGRESQELSHLFNQGLVATVTFLDESRARDKVRERPAAKTAVLLQEPIGASNLTTVFAIIDKPPKNQKPWRLPFFSMLVALYVTDRLRQRGVRAFTVRVNAA